MSDAASPIPLSEEPEPRGFDVVLRGYDRTQVDQHVLWLEGLITTAEEQQSAAETELAALRAEVAELRKRAQEWERGRPSYESLGERIGEMLALAEQEADRIRATAQAEVAGIHERIERETAEARARMDREAALGEQQRAQELARARQQSEQIVADAKRQAAETVSAARRQVEGLGRQRDGIRDDLAKLQRRLTAAVDAMAHMGEEDDAEAARPTGPAATTVRLPDAAAAAPRPRPTD